MKVFTSFLCAILIFNISFSVHANNIDDELINDINSLIQEEDTRPPKKESRAQDELQKIQSSSYTENSLPQIDHLGEAFKVAVHLLFSNLVQKQIATNTIDALAVQAKNSAYMVHSTSSFIIQGIQYCIQKKFLDTTAEKTVQQFLAHNTDTLRAVNLTLSKTSPLSPEEKKRMDNFIESTIIQQFTTVEKCIQHEYATKHGDFTLKFYPKTKKYVSTINMFLQRNITPTPKKL